jgi:hypothetical protein
MIDPFLLAEAIKTLNPGEWGALRPGTSELIARGTSSDAVITMAAGSGEPDPLIFRVPEALGAAGNWTPQAPPYKDIADFVRGRQFVPLLGAGASLMGNERDFQPEKPFYPSARQLARYLATEIAFPADDLPESNLAMVSAYFENQRHRPRLKLSLRRALGPLSNNAPRCAPGALISGRLPQLLSADHHHELRHAPRAGISGRGARRHRLSGGVERVARYRALETMESRHG